MMPMPAMMMRSSRMVLVSDLNRSVNGWIWRRHWYLKHHSGQLVVVQHKWLKLKYICHETKIRIGARIRQEWCDKWRYTDDDDLHHVYLRQIGEKWGRQGWDLVGGEIQRAESWKTLLEGAARKCYCHVIIDYHGRCCKKMKHINHCENCIVGWCGELLNSFRSFWKRMHRHIIDHHVICKDIKREQTNVVILILWHIIRIMLFHPMHFCHPEPWKAWQWISCQIEEGEGGGEGGEVQLVSLYQYDCLRLVVITFAITINLMRFYEPLSI